MAKAKASKGKSKNKSKAAPARNGDRLANARKIGERQETITHGLSPMEVDKERERVCMLLREIEKTESEIKNATASHKAKLVELKTQLKDSANMANTAKRDLEITVEEWLTDKNEVIRVRSDNGEIVGNRVARPAELQEDLPLDEGDDEEGDDDDTADENEAAGDFGAGGEAAP